MDDKINATVSKTRNFVKVATARSFNGATRSAVAMVAAA